MRVLPFLYPGDPLAEVAVLSRAEFKRLYRTMTPHDEETLYAVCEIDYVAVAEPDEIACDSCNADIGAEVWVYRLRPGQCRPGSDRA